MSAMPLLRGGLAQGQPLRLRQRVARQPARVLAAAAFPSKHAVPIKERDTRVKALGEEVAVATLPQDVVPAPALPELADATRTVAAVDSALSSIVKAPYSWYAQSLITHPLTTKACTALVGFVLGDVIAQHMAHADVMDLARMARLGAYGFVIDGPMGSWWYDQLEKYVYPENPQGTKAVLLKTMLDQTVYATIMTAVYFTVIKLLEGHPDQVLTTLEAKFWPTLAANYCVWPLAHLINFRFVASDFRILYNNVICIAWLTLVSYMTHTNVSALLHNHLH